MGNIAKVNDKHVSQQLGGLTRKGAGRRGFQETLSAIEGITAKRKLQNPFAKPLILIQAKSVPTFINKSLVLARLNI